jgi:hypothetical protein
MIPSHPVRARDRDRDVESHRLVGVQWALIDTSTFDATRRCSACCWLAWLLCIRATWVSLGLMSLILAGIAIGVFVWWLLSMGSSLVRPAHDAMDRRDRDRRGARIGMGWSLFRAKATGVVETGIDPPEGAPRL